MPKDPAFKTGLSPVDVEDLTLLYEECAEVIQATGKIGRHGYESQWPRKSGRTNRKKLLRELGHVSAAVTRLFGSDPKAMRIIKAAEAQKLRELPRYLHFSLF